ncbi:MAG: hypothetical protein ACTFAL_02130 [Candidatus Electronema sp. V4]|uniref:hypothetical protein n=1 Tax=Candidatus Electronema sp. V4 TaxID=3454756 RepID=UPI0040556332
MFESSASCNAQFAASIKTIQIEIGMIQLGVAAGKAGFQPDGAGLAMHDAGISAQAGEFAAGGGDCGQV